MRDTRHDTTVGDGDQNLEMVDDREHVTILREPREDAPDRDHVENPLERLKTFTDVSKARLDADVYAVVVGFREEKTDEREFERAGRRSGP